MNVYKYIHTYIYMYCMYSLLTQSVMCSLARLSPQKRHVVITRQKQNISLCIHCRQPVRLQSHRGISQRQHKSKRTPSQLISRSVKRQSG